MSNAGDKKQLPGGVAIEPATWRDLNSLRSLEKACFPLDSWPLWDLIGVLTLPSIIRLKATAGELMVGFIAGEEKFNEHISWIITVGVLPEYRRRGIGESLIRACQERFQNERARLCVRASNQEAVRLYQRLGYQQVGLWPNYYADREDAIVMELNLIGGVIQADV